MTGVLVEHKDGNVLFDAGIALNAMDTHAKDLMEAFPITKISQENRVENQLKTIGMKPGDVAFVVISHLHLDHAVQLTPFMDEKVP